MRIVRLISFVLCLGFGAAAFAVSVQNQIEVCGKVVSLHWIKANGKVYAVVNPPQGATVNPRATLHIVRGANPELSTQLHPYYITSPDNPMLSTCSVDAVEPTTCDFMDIQPAINTFFGCYDSSDLLKTPGDS